MKNLGIILLIITLPLVSFSQLKTDIDKLRELAKEIRVKVDSDKVEIDNFSKRSGFPIKIETDSTLIQIQYIDSRGNPQYYTIHNQNAAKTISTDKVYTGGGAGLSLSGDGIEVGEWDGGSALTTHQEFDTRVTNMDGSSVHWHSTHVGGTIMASGVESYAKGMAFDATLKCYDWNYDVAEMAEEAADGLLISNHSYGYLRGWEGSTWWGDPAISTDEDYRFGFYDGNSKNWDEVAYYAPFYLIVKSAGNDRNDSGDGSYPPDGPYDCIGQQGVAKNILTVGAVNDITGGYTQPSDVVMTSFSSWGPTDDGRIKPDIVANGTSLNSATSTGNADYVSSSGTSMSSPSVAGSLALLVQHWEDIFGTGSKMRSATAKALIIHTADESGTNDGPDYEFGWGLMNTQNAAAKISEDDTTDVITEHYLEDGETYTRTFTTTGTSPIRATLVWTDPPGLPPEASLDPADTILVNDLDIKITQASNTYYPWKLDKDNPSSAATNASENDVDNVEVIDIGSPLSATTYTITIDHDGSLEGGGQAFSLILSGDIDNNVAPVADFYCDNNQPTTDQTVRFYDASVNIPTSWQWEFDPESIEYLNGTSSISQFPEVRFDESGTYNVTLIVANSYGSNTLSESSFITAGTSPQNYCEAYTSSAYGYIDSVEFVSITNYGSGYTNVGGPDPDDLYYQDFTAQSTNITVGQSYPITVVNGTNDTYSSYLDLAIWVDWNRDSDFDDADEEVLCDQDNGGEGTFTVNVPTDAQVGNTRMRIRTKYYSDFGCTPCGTYFYGEVEDYTVNIMPASTTWNGTTTNWNDTSNWPDGIVPTQSFNVTIPTTPTGGNFPVIPVSTTITINKLTLEADAEITVNGTLQINE